MSNNKQSSVGNPFLQDAESIHQYNNQMFVVDYYPHPNGGTWQCCDANHYFRTRAKTKDDAIRECHKKWDEYQEKEKTMNNYKQSSVEWFAQKLYETLEIRGEGYVIDSLLDLAKAMHNEEKLTNYSDGYLEGFNRALDLVELTVEEYKNDYYYDKGLARVNSRIKELRG